MSPQRTAWHFYFMIWLRRRKPPWMEVRDEVPLSEERPRVDYLFLRKVQNPEPGDTGQTLRRLWPLVPQVAIAEFKSVIRPYRARGLDRLFMYLHAYWVAALDLKDRHDLVGVLIVAKRTPTLDADVEVMGLKFRDLQDGYWEIVGGLFRVYVVELDRVADEEQGGVLGLFGHNIVHTRESRQFWAEMVGTKEARMEAENLEGYDEIIARFLEELPPEQRLAGMAPEQRLAGLSADQVVLTLPDAILRGLSESYLATLPDSVRKTIRQRIGR